MKFKGFLALLGAAVIFSFFGLFVRLIDDMFGEFAQAGARMGIASIILLAIIIYRRTSLRIQRKDWWALLVLCLGVLQILAFVLSVNRTKIANTIFMFYSANLIASLVIGRLFYKEKFDGFKLTSLLVAFIGLFVFNYPLDLHNINSGVYLGLFAGFMDTVVNSSRKFLKGYDSQSLLLYQYGVGALIAAIFVLISGQGFVKEVSFLPVIVVLVFGVLLVVIGNLLNYGFTHFDLNAGTIILSTEVFFTIIVGMVFLNEFPLLKEWVGGIMIFIAMVVLQFDIPRIRNWLKTVNIMKFD